MVYFFFAKRLKYDPVHSENLYIAEIWGAVLSESENNKKSKHREPNNPAEETQIRPGSNFIDMSFPAIRNGEMVKTDSSWGELSVLKREVCTQEKKERKEEQLAETIIILNLCWMDFFSHSVFEAIFH